MENENMLYGLTDQHEPIDINDRDIMMSQNKNKLVAEDNISQCITFRMPRYYDGVDLTTKDFYFDYIDQDSEEVVSLPICSITTWKKIEGEMLPEVEGGYIALSIAIPYEVTKEAGTISFAISIIDTNNVTDGRQYIWQTKPSILIIEENLGKRQVTPVAPNGDAIGLEQLIADVQAISADVQAIRESDIYNLDDPNDDGEFILDTGSAPAYSS